MSNIQKIMYNLAQRTRDFLRGPDAPPLEPSESYSMKEIEDLILSDISQTIATDSQSSYSYLYAKLISSLYCCKTQGLVPVDEIDLNEVFGNYLYTGQNNEE